MKTKITFTAILLLILAAGAAAQNRVKLFDPTPISWTDPIAMASATPFGSFKSAEVYLSCGSGRQTSRITGPNGGGFIADNSLTINDVNVCGDRCFTVKAEPTYFVGQPMEAAYGAVGPFDLKRMITGSGLYRFNLLDFGYTYGSSGVYLETSCQIVPVNVPPADEPMEDPPTTGGGVICHRNSGGSSPLTLNVDANSIQMHLAHGDTEGPCGQ